MDTITLAAVADELNETLTGGRVQAIVQPDEHSLALEIYNRTERRWLLLSADPQRPCLHLLPEKARRGLERDTPLLLLTRKRLAGARLGAVFQVPWERVLHFSFSHGEGPDTALVAEIMGKWSNLLLVTPEGVILEALRRFGPAVNRYRTARPGDSYVPPPPQTGKTPIDLLTVADLEVWLGQTTPSEPLWRMLVQHVAGLSPLASRELVYRGTGDTLATYGHPNARAQGLHDALTWFRSLPRQGGWAPTVALDEEDNPSAFAPYELSHLGNLRLYASISQAAMAFYAAAGADSYAGRRAQVQALLDKARNKLNGRGASLGEQSVTGDEVEELKHHGEWILAYAWQVKTGDAELVADTGDGLLRIPLDPTLTPIANAQACFERYRKAKRAAARVPELLAEVDRDQDYLDQLQSDLHLADNAPQIEELREALLATGLVTDTRSQRHPTIPRSRPLRLRSTDGFTVIIGRNALQNEEVTWKLAGPEDLWLHAERVPGAHVLVVTGGREVPQNTLVQAATWAAYHSQARDDTKVSVLFTQRRHLRRIPHARPGQVRVLQAQSITVIPEPPPIIAI